IPKLPQKAWSLPIDLGRFQSSAYASPSFVTTGTGRNGSRCALTPTGPAPGPPPPWGVVKVLCRLKWQTSKPRSPGRVIPRIALRLAPSMYTCTPLAWQSSVISMMRGSNMPSVFGTVIMNAATSGPRVRASASTSTSPFGSDFTSTTSYPAIAVDAGLVPCQLVHQLERALGERLGGVRVEAREAGQAGHVLVEPRVVLHRARAERIEMRVHAVVHARETRVVADDV